MMSETRPELVDGWIPALDRAYKEWLEVNRDDPDGDRGWCYFGDFGPLKVCESLHVWGLLDRRLNRDYSDPRGRDDIEFCITLAGRNANLYGVLPDEPPVLVAERPPAAVERLTAELAAMREYFGAIERGFYLDGYDAMREVEAGRGRVFGTTADLLDWRTGETPEEHRARIQLDREYWEANDNG